MIRFICECGKELQAHDEHAGLLVLCPACQRQQKVPAASPTAIQSKEPIELPPAEAGVRKRRPVIRDEDELEEEETARAAGRRPSNSGKAVASLVLGILSLFCNILAGLPALIVGLLALRDIGRSRGRLGGNGLAIAGIVSACVGTLLSCTIAVPVGLPPSGCPESARGGGASTILQQFEADGAGDAELQRCLSHPSIGGDWRSAQTSRATQTLAELARRHPALHRSAILVQPVQAR